MVPEFDFHWVYGCVMVCFDEPPIYCVACMTETLTRARQKHTPTGERMGKTNTYLREPRVVSVAVCNENGHSKTHEIYSVLYTIPIRRIYEHYLSYL